MIALELENTEGLHPLPGYLANRVLAQSRISGFDDLDRQLVLLSKRIFIVTNALTSGTEDEVADKLELFKSALQKYLSINEQQVYLPLRQVNAEALPSKTRSLIVEFKKLKQRLGGFMNLDSRAVIAHRILTAKAICRIDRLIVERCATERETLCMR